jgi:hypothetical protein
VSENSPLVVLSEGESEDASLFSQNFNHSLNHYKDSEVGGSSQNSRDGGPRSVYSIDSGNVTQNIRKMDKVAVACNRKAVPIHDEDGNVIETKVKSEKMSRMQTFFAMLKCYCAINILLTPKSFANGGFLLSPIALVCASVFQTICAIKLSQCGLHVKKISYPDIVKKALGKKCKSFLEIALAVVQF